MLLFHVNQYSAINLDHVVQIDWSSRFESVDIRLSDGTGYYLTGPAALRFRRVLQATDYLQGNPHGENDEGGPTGPRPAA